MKSEFFAFYEGRMVSPYNQAQLHRVWSRFKERFQIYTFQKVKKDSFHKLFFGYSFFPVKSQYSVHKMLKVTNMIALFNFIILTLWPEEQ